MNNMRNKILMTLALLLTAVTGAWAQNTYTVQFKANGNTKTVENITLPHTFGCNWDDELGRGTGELDVIIQELYGLDGGTCASNVPESDNASVTCDMDDGDNQYIIVNAPFNGTATVTGYYFNSSLDVFNYSLEISIPGYTAEPAITVKWDPATKTGSFEMPAFDVEIAPIYAPVAQWAKVDNVDQLPKAIEGIYAESTDAIVTAGTVATGQGIVWYAIGTSATEAPALTAFSADVPTAKDITTAGDVYVWYYIKGADTPDGQEPTEKNTFNDSEICDEPIKVTVLSNKFDITFKAANANTIEGQNGKGTVTVKTGDAEAVDKTADIDENHQLKAVKMGSEVKLEAKPGYKFRKVEVKKGGPGSLTYATKEGAVTRIKFNRSGNDYYADFTYSNGSFTRTGGTQGYGFNGSWTMKEENGVLTMTANYNEMNIQWIYFVCTFYVDTNEYTESSTGDWNISFGGIEVNGKDITDQLTKVK